MITLEAALSLVSSIGLLVAVGIAAVGRRPKAVLPRKRTLLTIRSVTWLATWAERRAQRRALALLDDRLLRDIGRTRAEAEAEARKPFWKA